MLILAQILTKTPSWLLTKVLRPRSVAALLDLDIPLVAENSSVFLKVLSRHLTSINLTHRVTIYEASGDPQILFLNILEEFPPELIPTLVSVLVTEDITPPMAAPYADLSTFSLEDI